MSDRYRSIDRAQGRHEHFGNVQTKRRELFLHSLHQELGSRIVSLGGGTPVREENRAIIKSLGKVVYLKASPDTIYSRVKHDTKRPLLQCENPKARIEAMLTERNPIYESVADIVIEVDGKHIKQVVQEVAEAVKK